MVTTRYSDQQGSKSRQKVMRLYKQWHRPISKRFIKPPYSIREQPRSTRNVVAYPRPAFSAKNRKNYAPTSFDQQVQVSQGHTFCTEIRKIEIPRSMVVEAFPWLVNDRAALRLRRIWCIPTHNSNKRNGNHRSWLCLPRFRAF